MCEVITKADGILYHPYTVSLHMTDACNSRCRFCAEASYEHTQDLTHEEEIFKFIESHDTNKWTALNIHGGEPTLSPKLLEVIQTAKKLGYRYIILQTNAQRIGTDREFAEELDASGVDLYNIGFHGSNSEIMDRLTGVSGSFDRAINGIRTIVEFHKPIRITTVISAQNYKDLSAIVSLASQEGISHINISAMQIAGSALSNLDMLFVTYYEARPYIEEAVRLAQSLGIVVTFEGLPYCVLKGLEKYQVDWAAQQLKVLYRTIIIDDFNKFLTQTIRTFGLQCENCLKRDVCSGVYKEYANKQGWSEFHPYR